MILGISSFTYGWSVGVDGQMPAVILNHIDLIQQAEAFKLKCVQFGDNLPVHNLTREGLDELKAVSHAKNIRLEIGARKLTRINLEQYLEYATFLDAPLVRFIIDGDNYEPEIKEVVTIIKAYVPELQKRNIVLGIENHDRFKASELAFMMDAVNSNNVGICLDCVNSMGAGEGLEHVVRHLAPHTVNVHIKDYKIKRLPHKMGFTITGEIAGQGMTNVPWLMDQLLRYNKCKSAILEQWVEPETNIESTIQKEKKWAEQSINYLQRLPYFM